MQQESQKILKEKEIFQSYLSISGLDAFSIEFGDKPDVIFVDSKERKVGLEISRLDPYAASSLAGTPSARRAVRENIVRGAFESYVKDFAREQFYLGVTFSDDFEISSAMHSKNFLKKIVGALKADDSWQSMFLDPTQSFGIEMLQFRRFTGGGNNWETLQSYSVGAIDVAGLRERVRRKSDKSKYYKSVDALWLLLYVDFWVSEADQEIILPANFSIEPSAFERVILFKPAFHQIVEVSQKM